MRAFVFLLNTAKAKYLRASVARCERDKKAGPSTSLDDKAQVKRKRNWRCVQHS
jgi:hypothetical protein